MAIDELAGAADAVVVRERALEHPALLASMPACSGPCNAGWQIRSLDAYQPREPRSGRRSPFPPSKGFAMTARDVVLCHPVRTAIGTYRGSLKDVPAPDLGAA